ncbi:MAG: hypothetical protein HZB16_06460 [Armatimonadetes bacterium]|nr:hypothetical protein [Armatimonadota bacterium]
MVLDERGIAVERWVGPVLSITWAEVTDASWLRSDRLRVAWPGGQLCLDGHVAGLDRFAEIVDTAMAEFGGGKRRLMSRIATIERWLCGFKYKRVELSASQPMVELRGRLEAYLPLVVMVAAAVVGAYVFSAAARCEPYCGYFGFFMLVLVAYLGAVAGAMRVTGALIRAVTGPQYTTCAVRADGRHLSVRHDDEEQVIAWDDIQSVRETAESWELRTANGTHVDLPKRGEFGPVADTVRRVLAARQPRIRLQRPVTDAALSLANDEPRANDVDRGLSRAESEKADA